MMNFCTLEDRFMAEEKQSPKNVAAPAPEKAEPGLFDTVGSFPVWLLKIIKALTPESLISKTPPPKKKVRL